MGRIEEFVKEQDEKKRAWENSETYKRKVELENLRLGNQFKFLQDIYKKFTAAEFEEKMKLAEQCGELRTELMDWGMFLGKVEIRLQKKIKEKEQW